MGPLLTAYLDHMREVRGLEPKTCEGMLVTARRILAWYGDQVPGQPLAAMTGEHVLAVVEHLLSMSSKEFDAVREHLTCSDIPTISALVRSQ